MDMNWDFPSDEDIKITDGTQAVVTAIPGRNGDLIDHRTTRNGKDVLSVQFKVAQGEHKGKRASLSMWPDPNSWSFRAQVSALTGIEIGKGGRKLNIEDIKTALAENSYMVKLFIDDRGYTIAKYIDDKVEYVPVEMPEENSAPNTTMISTADEDDDDIMF